MLSSKTGVPVEALRPHIKRFMDTFETGAKMEMRPEVREKIKCTHPLEFLAARVGCHVKTLEGYMCRKHDGRYVEFDVADKILCALDRVQLWQQDPCLREVYYDQIDLGRIDTLRPVVELAEAA